MTDRGQAIGPGRSMSWAGRIDLGREEVGTILRKIWPYLPVGIGLGAVTHGWVPADLFEGWAGSGNAFAVLVAVLLGIPLYSNAAGTFRSSKPSTTRACRWAPCSPS